MNYEDLTTLGIAFGLGLLVGSQRQKTDHQMAGVRTFTLISMLGVVAGFLTRDLDNPFIIPAFGLGLTGLLIMANYIKLRKEPGSDVGQTTEVAALLMFAFGSYLVLGNQVIAILIGGTMAIVLYSKAHVHEFIDRLQQKDLAAIMTFAGISLVILPILPDKTFGPYDVLNAHNIWLMVTLIVGISVVGYFIYKFAGKKIGIISNGILGGLISSTATTVSYSRKTADARNISMAAAFVITAASAISLVRVIIEVSVVIPEKLPLMILPLASEFVFIAALGGGLFYLINRKEKDDEMPEPQNPAQFKSALVFGLLYGLILLAVAFAKDKFGNSGLYVVSIISGLTDVDAITLSISQLIKGGSLEADKGWRLILVASLSNLMFKGILVAVLGAKRLILWVGLSFGLAIATGLVIIWLWPGGWHL